MADRTFQIATRSRTLLAFDQEKEKEWLEPFVFIQAADTQFGMIDSYIKHKPNPGWEEEIQLTTRAVEAANRMNPTPRFFVVCGDLVDAYPGTKNKKSQEDDFKRVFSKLKPEITLVCVCGNHDLGDCPTQQSVDSYTKSFGNDYFSFCCGGVKFIVLNSQFYRDCSMVPNLAKDQDFWLEQQLEEVKREKYTHTIIFQHIPWFLFSPTEDKDTYFNIEPQLRLSHLEKFRDAGVRAIFCGHYHRNAGGFYCDMEMVTTSAIGAQLGSDSSGMRVVTVQKDAIHHRYYALGDIPTNVDLSLST